MDIVDSVVFWLVVAMVLGVIAWAIIKSRRVEEPEPEPKLPRPPPEKPQKMMDWIVEHKPVVHVADLPTQPLPRVTPRQRAMQRGQSGPHVQRKIAEHGEQACIQYTLTEERALQELERRQRARGESNDNSVIE